MVSNDQREISWLTEDLKFELQKFNSWPLYLPVHLVGRLRLDAIAAFFSRIA
uniref:Uncharacterized protein n=1 Tax=Lyngbya confervoides BDU141951 TaxID=1574623 RepID=A0A8T6QNF7_9CYAN